MQRLAEHPWITFTLLRLAFFLVPLGIGLAIGLGILVSTVAAALIGLALSVILLPRLRAAMAADIESIRTNSRQHTAPTVDEDVEDAVVDSRVDRPQRPAATVDDDEDAEAEDAGPENADAEKAAQDANTRPSATP